MSAGDPAALRKMAQWRRDGYGVWKITMIIEGFDDVWIHLLPGRLSDRHVKKFAIRECAQEHDVKPRLVHIVTTEKLT